MEDQNLFIEEYYLNIIDLLHHKRFFHPLFVIRIPSGRMKAAALGQQMDGIWMKLVGFAAKNRQE